MLVEDQRPTTSFTIKQLLEGSANTHLIFIHRDKAVATGLLRCVHQIFHQNQVTYVLLF